MVTSFQPDRKSSLSINLYFEPAVPAMRRPSSGSFRRLEIGPDWNV